MRRNAVDVPRLFELWNDREMTRTEIARTIGLTDKQLGVVAARHGLQNRGPRPRNDPAIEASPEEDAASGDSLALSPWVQARIKELGIGVID